MATILYGVAGEGYGHAIRSKVVIDELRKRHKVIVAGGGRAKSYLSKFYAVREITHFRFVHRKNSASIVRTALLNFILTPKMLLQTLSIARELRKKKIDLVMTDFEPSVHYAALLSGIPCISLGYPFLHPGYLRTYRLKHQKGSTLDYVLTYLVNKVLAPKADREFITTFFNGHMKDKRISIVDPVLRPLILEAKPRNKDYVLVYQTTQSNKKLIKALFDIPERFIVYGFDKNEKVRNIRFKKFSDEEFISDLANAKAVIGNGGFSLMAECYYLKKPLLSFPVGNRYEQVLNSLWLMQHGYGSCSFKPGGEAVESFLEKLGTYASNLRKRKNFSNKKFFASLQKEIEWLLEL